MALGQMYSQRFGYAAHALAYMANKSLGALTTISELTGWVRSLWPDASTTYLSNVVQRLARGGLLRGHRGISGGYSLARPADKITLRDLAEVLEGVSQEHCALSLGPQCANGVCNIQCTLRGIEEAYLDSLQKITIAQVTEGIACKLPQTTTPAAGNPQDPA